MSRPFHSLIVISIAALFVETGLPSRIIGEDAQASSNELTKYVLTHAGDPQNGKMLFDQEEVTKCLICHKVEGEGGTVGPDLTVIGGKFDRPHLIESLLEPSRQIVEGYRSSSIVLADGRILTGIVKPKSDTQVSLFTVDGKQQDISRDQIEAQQISDISIMPEGLQKSLTRKQFTDLIAYLETLHPTGKGKFGSSITGPINLRDGFEVTTVTTGLDAATALEVLPDGRVLVCEQTGAVRVIENGKLLAEPFVTLPVDRNWERGVIGVTIDPNFPETPYVYVCWVAAEPYPHHRVGRFIADGNIARAGSEQVLLVGDDQRTMGGKVPNGHQGGALHFGPDGKLYISIGEQTAGARFSQELNTFLGKILRINADGTIPVDNPLLGSTSEKYQAIWAYGCRNPFTFAFRKPDGLMLINDVGGKFEEINPGVAGVNYGWPVVDHGPQPPGSKYTGPIHWYPQASIAGGDFAPPSFSNGLAGNYFFADFVHGWIHVLDPEHPEEVREFASGLRRPVDLRFGPQGDLFVLLRNAWVIDDKFQGGTGSLLKFSPRHNKQAATTSSNVQLDEQAIDESAGNLPAYRITTPQATYFLEKSGAGLSSLIDRDGNDWINFHPQPGSGAGGEFRGFPNAVYKEGGNFFHPRNQSTDRSTTRVTENSSQKVTIEAESENGEWACRYDFFPDRLTFTMTKMSPQRNYWVLYEGTPGGNYDDDDWWLTSRETDPQPLTINHERDLAGPEWIAFGDRQLDRALLLAHHQDDQHIDRFYQMQRKMTVFGFGRDGIHRLMNSVPQSFSLMFVESRRPQVIKTHAQRLTPP